MFYCQKVTKTCCRTSNKPLAGSSIFTTQLWITGPQLTPCSFNWNFLFSSVMFSLRAWNEEKIKKFSGSKVCQKGPNWQHPKFGPFLGMLKCAHCRSQPIHLFLDMKKSPSKNTAQHKVKWVSLPPNHWQVQDFMFYYQIYIKTSPGVSNKTLGS